MPSKRIRSAPVSQAEGAKPAPAQDDVMKCTLCSELIDTTDDHRLLDCGVCKRTDNFVHEDCIAAYLKKEGRGQAQKTGFKCPTILANGKPCKGHISKSHPHVAANERKKELARQAPPPPQNARGATTTAKIPVTKAVKAAMAVRPVVAPGPSSTPFSPAIPPSHPTTTFVLGDFLARAPLADPPSVPTPPPIPAPTTTPATGNAWLDRARAAALQSRQAQQGVGKQAPQAQRPQTRLPQAELPQQLSQGSDEAEDVASFASGDEDCAWSSASHSICSSSGGSSTPGATTCTALGSLSPTASLLASPANPGSPLPSPSLAKQLAQGLNEKTVTLSTGFGAPAATLDQAIDVSSSPATSIAAIRNLICSGQLAWLAPVATELQHVMTAAAGGGQVLFCTLTSGADGSTMPPGDAADPIVAVQPVFELSVTPVGLSGCGTADLSQALGVKVVRDPRTLACYNPEDCFGPGCSLVSFEVVLPAAGAHVSGLKGAAAQPVVAQGVPIRRSQILAAAGVATGSEEAAAATAAALPSTQCQLTARAQSFQSESDDELALELARLCGCNC